MNTMDETLLTDKASALPAAKKRGGKKKKKGKGAFGRFICRMLLLIFTLVILTVAAAALLLNTLLTGPSPVMRDLVTATLLEYPETARIPELFLEPAVLAQIRDQAGNPPRDTLSDPSRISPDRDAALWPDSPGGIRLNTWTNGACTAHILQIRDPSRLRPGSADQISRAMEDNGALAALAIGPATEAGGFLGLTQEGILVVSTENSLEKQDLNLRDITPCGPVLILNGTVNQAVYGSNSGLSQRWALGQRADGTLIFLHITLGTYRDLADVLVEYGAVNACSLGSGSGQAMACFTEGNRFSPDGQLHIFGSDAARDSQSAAAFWLVLPEKEG